jgi:hypothetical protein
MKNILIKITFIVLSLSINYEALSDSKTIYGNLFVTTTTVVTTAAVTVRDCDGNIIRSIPATSNSYSKQSPATNTGQTVRFMVYRKDPSANTYLYQDNVSINSITYSTSDGSYTHTLNNALLVNSRYNYLVRVYTSTESYATMYEEQEFTISSGSAIMPIGAVISYIGNSSNLSDLEGAGWFKCDGRAISTLTLNLTADERTAFVNVVGSNLPDLRTGGELTTGVRSSQIESMRNHTHSGTTDEGGNHRHSFDDIFYSESDSGRDPQQNQVGSGDTDGDNEDRTKDNITGFAGVHSHPFTTGNPGNSVGGVTSYAGNENRPDNMAVYYLIRGR